MFPEKKKSKTKKSKKRELEKIELQALFYRNKSEKKKDMKRKREYKTVEDVPIHFLKRRRNKNQRTGVQYIILLLLSFFLSFANGMDYYQRLGVKRNASAEDISKAYRKLAREYHPDIAPDKEKDFMEIANAYETLSDPEKRKLYDMYGEKYAQGAQSQRGEYGAHGFNFDDDLVNEIFRHFGGGKGGGASGRAGNFHFKFSTGGGGPGGSGGGPGGGFHGYQEEYEDIYSSNEILKINARNIESILNDITFLLVINFYSSSCSHCVQFKKQYLNLSKKYEGFITFSVVNCQDEESICRKYKVRSLPHIIVMKKNRSYEIYHGQRTEEGINSFLNKNTPFSYSEISDKIRLDKFLTKSVDKPKILVFVSHVDNIIMLKALSKEFEERIHIGVIYNSNYKIMKLFKKKIQTPAILVVEDIDKLQGEWTQLKKFDFNILSLKLSHIVAQSRLKSNLYGKIANYQELTKKKYEAGYCNKKDSQICFLILKFSNQNYKLFDEEIKKVASKFSNDPLKILYVNVYQQPYVLEAFGLKNKCQYTNCLMLLAFRPKRQRFKLFDGEVVVNKVHSFVENVVSGATSITSTLVKDIKFVDAPINDEL